VQQKAAACGSENQSQRGDLRRSCQQRDRRPAHARDERLCARDSVDAIHEVVGIRQRDNPEDRQARGGERIKLQPEDLRRPDSNHDDHRHRCLDQQPWKRRQLPEIID
jgi:hypothetical protein